MPVRFILGRAGSGKTRHCFEQIAAMLRARPMGSPIFLLLPKQATFEAEREFTCRLGGFSRLRVVAFEQLGRDILADCGDVGIPQVTAVGRRLIVGHLLRTHEKDLKFYRASARRPGLAAELDATFGELERAGLDGAALENLEVPPSLEEKLHDVRLLHGAYKKYLGQDRLDPQLRLKLILERVGNCSLLKNATLFVDDFFDFTGYEQKLLVAVATVCQEAQIALLFDPKSPIVGNIHHQSDELSLFHRTERTYRSLQFALLEAGARVDPPLILREPKRFVVAGLAELERNLFAESSPYGGEGIELMEAADARSEVDMVAREIRAELQRGLRLRDIAVLMRDVNDYQELIGASFGEHGLTYFMDRRRTAEHHPVLQFCRSCLLIAQNGWPHEAVMMLLRTGLAGISEDEADELENYVLRHRIRSGMWELEQVWRFEPKHVDGVRQRVVEKLSPFVAAVQKTQPMSRFISLLFSLLEEFGVRKIVAKWMGDADLEQRGEHEQVWAELVDLLEQMNGLLGDEAISLADFVDALEGGLESFDLALTPPTLDGLLVGQIDRTRTPEVKVVFVLGLNEGQFPRLTREDCVLSDAERRSLRERKIDLDEGTDRRLLDERLLGYLAFTRASRKLIVSRCLGNDKGLVTHPSAFWGELIRLFPKAIPRLERSDLDAIGTPRQVVTALMRWARDGAAMNGPWPALYQWLATYPKRDDAIGLMRDRAWRALRYLNEAKLSAEIAGKLFPTPLAADVGQLETFAACPFRHFVKYGLRLEQREQPKITPMDLGRAYHRVMEDLVGDLLRERRDWVELDPKAIGERIGVYAAQIGRSLRGELMLSNARNRYLLERIEKTLAAAVAAQQEMQRRGKYRPVRAGVQFGDGIDALPAYRLVTPAGNEVLLQGKIDRVDLHESDGTFAVSDYKARGGTMVLDRVFYGLSLQLLTHLLVVRENGEKLAGRKIEPAAAFFLQLLRSPTMVDHPSEALAADHPDFHLRIKPRGLVSAPAVGSFDTKLIEGHSVTVAAYVKKDGQFGFRDRSDVADESEFSGLLEHVQWRLGELADRLIAGDVSVRPYWINRETPCANCEFRGVCRFEPGINQYNVLNGMKRDEVLVKLGEEASNGD
jgi:ATP-dependent helicase/nuclease subunit B